MNRTQLAIGGFWLRLDGDVFEMFGRLVLDSVRIPAAWVGVELEARKNDVIRVRVGIRGEEASSVYDTKSMMFGGPWSFDIPAAQEALVRQFFDEVETAGQSA